MKNGPPDKGGPRKVATDNQGKNPRSTDPTPPASTAAERPLFVLTLRPEPGVDGTRALRRFLKVALRSFRLRCISANEVRP